MSKFTIAFNANLSIVISPNDLCKRILALNVFKLFDTMVNISQLCMECR